MSAKKKSIGRPRKYKTKKEAREASLAYQKDYLKVRRERYKNDPNYRETLIQRDRDRYRAINPDFCPKGFGSKSGKAAKFAATDSRYLTVDEMAVFIGVVPKVMAGWIAENKFPRPNKSLPGNPAQRAYTVGQANDLSEIMKKGLAGRAAFRATDTEVITQLHTVMQSRK